MQYPRFFLALVIAVALSLPARVVSGDRSAASEQAGMARPAGVPDLLDPAVRAMFVPLSVAHLEGDPDFPALFLGNTGREYPQFLLVILDARNGKQTWSLKEDATIFFLLLTDPTTVQQAFLDEGFATTGKPSGKFIAGGPEAAEHLLVRLRESHERSRTSARFAPAAWQSR